MASEDSEDTTVYKVVVNHEEQYSIWPADRENALGWNDVGKVGSKVECLAHIKEIWTDMRPLSVRRRMEEAARNPPPPPQPSSEPEDAETESIVTRLSEGEHAVEVSLRPAKTVQAFQDCITRGYVHIKFPNTRGGTELGVRLDRDATDLSHADFSAQTGRVRLVGNLTLDYVKVQCISDIELETLTGKGHLQSV